MTENIPFAMEIIDDSYEVLSTESQNKNVKSPCTTNESVYKKYIRLNKQPRTTKKARRWIIILYDTSRYHNLVTYIKMLPQFKYYCTIETKYSNKRCYAIYAMFRVSTGFYKELMCNSIYYPCLSTHEYVNEYLNDTNSIIEEYGIKGASPKYSSLTDNQLIHIPDPSDLLPTEYFRYKDTLFKDYQKNYQLRKILDKKVYYVYGDDINEVDNWISREIGDKPHDEITLVNREWKGVSRDSTIKTAWYFDFEPESIGAKKFMMFCCPFELQLDVYNEDMTLPNRYNTIYISTTLPIEKLYSLEDGYFNTIQTYVTTVHITGTTSEVREPSLSHSTIKDFESCFLEQCN